MGEEKRVEFIKATIYTTTQGAEALAAVLTSLGIEEYCVEDPADLDFIVASKDALAWDFIDIHPVSEGIHNDEASVIFWLEKGAEEKVHELRTMLLKLKSDEQYGFYGVDADFGRLWLSTEVVYDDWKEKYKESFRTFSPCEGIEIVPPWEQDADRDHRENRGDGDRDGSREEPLRILIDPGMAFGTGSHETTAMCLSMLKTLIKPGNTVLDAGTGSGILAIAAALLGAGRVHAVEIDADAAASATRNIEANGVAEKVALVEGDMAADGILPADARFDLITANLNCSLLKMVLPIFNGVLKDKGAIILSGLLDAQEESVLDMLEDEGLRAAEIVLNGEWLMIEARR